MKRLNLPVTTSLLALGIIALFLMASREGIYENWPTVAIVGILAVLSILLGIRAIYLGILILSKHEKNDSGGTGEGLEQS